MSKKIQANLVKASLEDLPILKNLARFYCYDMSRHCGLIEDWDWAFPENGMYEGCDIESYLKDNDRYAFLIKVKNELAGFVLIHKNGTKPDTEWNMGEFFIVAKFQSKGIGKQVASKIFQQFPGKWEVTVIPENTPALAFWRSAVNEFTGSKYLEETKNVYPGRSQPNRYVLNFNSD